jgi:alkyl sulfatase BDS1-like metallo-beta-lactamase superfamily hydrolase
MEDILRATSVSRFFDSMAVRLNGPDAANVELSVKILFTDLEESYLLDIENAVLHHRPSKPDAQADASLSLTHELFVQMLTGKAGLKEMLLSDQLEVDGSTLDLLRFFSLFDKPTGSFNIVTP